MKNSVSNFDNSRLKIVNSKLGKALSFTTSSTMSSIATTIEGIATYVSSARPDATSVTTTGDYLSLIAPKGYYDGTAKVECKKTKASELCGGSAKAYFVGTIKPDHATKCSFVCTSIPGYQQFVAENFCVAGNYTGYGFHVGGNDTANYGSKPRPVLTYDSTTGTVTISPIKKRVKLCDGGFGGDLYVVPGLVFSH